MDSDNTPEDKMKRFYIIKTGPCTFDAVEKFQMSLLDNLITSNLSETKEEALKRFNTIAWLWCTQE